MDIEFDAAKDTANIAKHGVSLARAVELAGVLVIEDRRFAEPRFASTARSTGLPTARR